MENHESNMEEFRSSLRTSTNNIDPLDGLESMDGFIKGLDTNFEQHLRCLGQFRHLLEAKGKIDQKYAHSLKTLSLHFVDLSRMAVNDRIRDLVLALARNFKNMATNLESMSFDLLSESRSGFDQCKADTSKQLAMVKEYLKDSYARDYAELHRFRNLKTLFWNPGIITYSPRKHWY